jgi:hypothetical protein
MTNSEFQMANGGLRHSSFVIRHSSFVVHEFHLPTYFTFNRNLPMLALSTVHEIDRLLNEGKLSQRQIAQRLGVSRGSVGAIASGQRPLVGKTDPSPGLPAIKSRELPQRCPACGYRIYVPCQICAARSYRAAKRRKLMSKPAPAPGTEPDASACRPNQAHHGG